ncbi:hypothetical protein Tco_0564521 [Tanacetum coccineum]
MLVVMSTDYILKWSVPSPFAFVFRNCFGVVCELRGDGDLDQCSEEGEPVDTHVQSTASGIGAMTSGACNQHLSDHQLLVETTKSSRSRGGTNGVVGEGFGTSPEMIDTRRSFHNELVLKCCVQKPFAVSSSKST